uniref:hypothetical protein n=1 Tax=uncultured Mucilaginibacter sp. TaxID=797541 RepID=UPI0025CD15E6
KSNWVRLMNESGGDTFKWGGMTEKNDDGSEPMDQSLRYFYQATSFFAFWSNLSSPITFLVSAFR